MSEVLRAASSQLGNSPTGAKLRGQDLPSMPSCLRRWPGNDGPFFSSLPRGAIVGENRLGGSCLVILLRKRKRGRDENFESRYVLSELSKNSCRSLDLEMHSGTFLCGGGASHRGSLKAPVSAALLQKSTKKCASRAAKTAPTVLRTTSVELRGTAWGRL